MSDPARQERLAPDVARWLVGGGAESVAETVAGLDAGATELHLGQRLRDAGMEPERAAAVLSVATARRRARARWTDAERLWFTPSALEQASDPAVSAWRAQRFEGRDVVDAGCGAGGDLIALAGVSDRVVGLDRDLARLHLAAANLTATGRHADLVAGDATAGVVTASTMHADPARRRDGRRVRRLGETSPPVDVLLRGAHRGAGIVVGPAVSLADPTLADPVAVADVEVEFVQVGSRLVEAVLWTGELRDGRARATILADDGPTTAGRFTLVASRGRTDGTLAAPAEQATIGDLGEILLVPAPALVRARLHGEHAAEVGGWRLGRHVALLGAPEPPPRSPWSQALVVETVLPARPKAVRRWLASADDVPLEIELHGAGLSVAPWEAALKGVRRGPRGRRLLLVRLDHSTVAVLARPVTPSA